MSSREEQKEETRKLILETTVTMLLDPSFSSLNTNELAKKAGVSKGSIFHHFGSKDKLTLIALEQIVLNQFEDFMETNNQDLENFSPVELLSHLTKSNLNLIVEHPNLSSLLMQILSDFKDETHLLDLQESIQHMMTESYNVIIPLFEGLGWAKDEVILAARIYLSIIDGLGIQQELERNLPNSPSFGIDVEKTTQMIVGLFDKRQKHDKK